MPEIVRVLFALPAIPNVFVEETGQLHALSPAVVIAGRTVQFGGALDVHRCPPNEADVLATSLLSDDVPFIALYRCLRLLACHRHIAGETLNLILTAVANGQPLAGYEGQWKQIQCLCPSVEELCAALDVALESGLSVLCTLQEMYREIEVGRLVHDSRFEAFGVLSPAALQKVLARQRALFQELERPLSAFLQQEQGAAPSLSQVQWMLALVAAFERMFDCQFVYALGLVLLVWKRIPDSRRSDPLEAAEAAMLMASFDLDGAEVIADAIWADEQARAMIPPAQSQGILPLPIVWYSFKKPFSAK